MLFQGKLHGAGAPVQIRVEAGRIAAIVRDLEAFQPADFACDSICSPLLDPQVNGGMGVSFSEPGDPTRFNLALSKAQGHGISQIFPTVITTDPENLEKTLESLVHWRQGNKKVAQAVPGFHLEGPGISPLDGFRGAHPLSAVRVWTIKEYLKIQELSGGLIRMVTLAPEVAGQKEVIKKMARDGVVVAMGHTNADANTIARAIDAGVSLFTHWGNGLARMVDRHNNPLWSALGEEGLAISLIADGHHLPDAMIRVAVKCKFPEKLILTADTGPLAGMPEGVYDLWGSRVRVSPEGKLTVDGTPYLAGSGAWLDTCLNKMVQITGKPLETILSLTAESLGKLLRIPAWDPRVGDSADMTLINSGKITRILIRGEMKPIPG